MRSLVAATPLASVAVPARGHGTRRWPVALDEARQGAGGREPVEVG